MPNSTHTWPSAQAACNKQDATKVPFNAHETGRSQGASKQEGQTWPNIHPTAALKVLQVLAGDDVIGAPRDVEALLGALLLDQGHKGIGPTAEVHHGVIVMQVEAEHLGNLPQESYLGEVAAIAAVPAAGLSSIDTCAGCDQGCTTCCCCCVHTCSLV